MDMRILMALVALSLIAGGCSGSEETFRERSVDIDAAVLGATDQDLTVMFVGGPVGLLRDDPCAGEYEIDVVQSADQLTVTVHELRLASAPQDLTCTAGGTFRQLVVELDEPIATRLLTDGHDGSPQTVLDPGALLWPQAPTDGLIVRSRDADRSGLRATYGTDGGSITMTGGPIDESEWNMERAAALLGDTAEPISVRAGSADAAVLITSNEASTISVAFDEDGNHYRVTAYGTISSEALLTFVADLALDPQSRTFEIPFQADIAIPAGPAPVPSPTATPTGATALEPVPLEAEAAWPASESTRDVANYLEALRQGAWEQAAWPLSNNGVLFNGQSPDETGAEFLERSCAPDLCNGPYLIRGEPGYVSPVTAQAMASVSVMHLDSGEETRLLLFTFEGQRMIGGLPPLVSSDNEASLLTSLFGDEPPNRVVVERFDAFEIWNGSSHRWVTSWHADSTTQVEGGASVSADGVHLLSDPQRQVASSCARLLERDGEVLVLDQCVTDRWELSILTRGDPVEPAAAHITASEASSPWYSERAGVVVVGERDAEGNLSRLVTNDGVDLIAGDYASLVAISTDGVHVAYVDHRDPAASSHFWSPVVVVRTVATGEEIGRWTLDASVICIEFAGDWIVACEADETTTASGYAEQASLAAINIVTGEVNRVITGTRVFLPTDAG